MIPEGRLETNWGRGREAAGPENAAWPREPSAAPRGQDRSRSSRRGQAQSPASTSLLLSRENPHWLEGPFWTKNLEAGGGADSHSHLLASTVVGLSKSSVLLTSYRKCSITHWVPHCFHLNSAALLPLLRGCVTSSGLSLHRCSSCSVKGAWELQKRAWFWSSGFLPGQVQLLSPQDTSGLAGLASSLSLLSPSAP